MAPLPPSNTPRYQVHYSTSGGVEHTLQVRAPAVVSPATFGTFIDAFFLALGTDIYQTTLTFVEFAPVGSDIFNIVTTGQEGNVYGSGVMPAVNLPLFISFVARSPGGRRGRIEMFGWKFVDTSWRYNFGENPNIDAAVVVLQGGAGYPLGIDGTELVWKQYANVGYDDHYVQQLRA